MNFLHELTKEKHQGTQIKGYNDELLASSVPGSAKEYRTSTKESTVEKAHKSPVAKKPVDMVAKVIGAR